MIFEPVTSGGCRSYLLGSEERGAAIVIDPLLPRIDEYRALAHRHKLAIAYLLDTHTHADHFSAAKEMGREWNVPVAVHRLSPAPYADLRLEDGDMLDIGGVPLKVLYTPGHTADSISLLAHDRLFTGDTLLIGGTGRTDLPTGDANALHASLFDVLLKLDPSLKVFPAHDYKGNSHSTLGHEIATNPRLKMRDRPSFVAMMGALNLQMPEHLTEALRVNMYGGKPVTQLVAEAASRVSFITAEDAARRLDDLVFLDVREKGEFLSGHIAGARHLPRGRLELDASRVLPDAAAEILVCCEDGRLSTLAAARLREMGFLRTAALEGGLTAWREKGFALSAP